MNFEDDSKMYSLTKAWLGLFFFAVVINVVPFLPGWDIDETEPRLVVQEIHTALCSSSSFNTRSPETPSTFLSEAVGNAGGIGVQQSSTDCVVAQWSFKNSHGRSLVRYVERTHRRPFSLYFRAHPERGPPSRI